MVVPAYNEAENIGKVVAGVPGFVDLIVVVDDCSTDGTTEAVGLCPRLVLVKNKRNVGVGGSILNGHAVAYREGSDIDVVMAGDNQMNPRYMGLLLDAVIDGADYAKGNRFSAGMKGMPKHRVFGNFVLSLLTKFISGYWGISDSQNGYTALRMKIFPSLDVAHIAKRYQFENDMLVHLGAIHAKVKDVPIPSEYHGEKSRLRLRDFIPQTVVFLTTRFVWRRRVKYLG